ncbi:MAG: CCA tRNA nucleotidyltransferase, partial [Hyphomonas sp.]|nr:CCA tRNA nucleotidyltransferase [Hyphomonas sp.]
MSPIERIAADWLTSPDTQAVMAALEAARPGGSRFVGGCVRNEIRGVPADDIDIATQLPPEAVMAAMQAAGIRALPTGIEHGTVTAIADGNPFEITTLRRDVETDGRRAVVA